jgi:hypothetical protein
VVDEVPAPDRLEEPVGEAEGEDVLRRLLAQEVIDAEDLTLTALSKSLPNGFSMITRERSTRPAALSVSMTESAARGGTLR